MKYHIHENGWTVVLDDFNFSTATQDDINQISKLLATNTLVVAKKQKLTVEDELRVVNMFKDPESFPDDWADKHMVVPGTDSKILRVTGELNEHGEPGLFGHVSDLDWHCNKPAVPTRKPIVWLYGVKGTVGSRTTWNNNIIAYNDLDQETKDMLEPLEGIFGYEHGRYTVMQFEHIPAKDINTHYTPKIVQTNIAGKKGLFFPFLQLFYFKGMSEEDSRKIIEPMSKHITQDKYCYHHEWDDGDVVLAEQVLGIHKRWAFDGMPNRVLHRATVDFPDQNYLDNK
jgi:alpha-ketoglutarate-dependent taurine dioxygenase